MVAQVSDHSRSLYTVDTLVNRGAVPRILHLVHQYPPDHLGGTELYTQTVAQALGERNHAVSVFTRCNVDGVGSEDRQESDVSVHRAWNGDLGPTQRFLTSFGNMDLENAFDHVLDRFRPDLVHVQHLMGMPTSLLTRIQRRRIPFVITLHDFWWVCANAQLVTNYSGEICNGPELWVNCARCALARSNREALWPAVPMLAAVLAHRGAGLTSMLNKAARLIAPSHFVKNWYVEHGVAAERIDVLAHGIDVTNLPRRVERRRPLRFLYAGGLAWQKGVHVLLEAFGSVTGPCELWIAGDESFDLAYSSRLHDLVAQTHSQQVRFLGKLSRESLWQTLTQVDVVMVPALWYETFSLIIHEAFAAGVPVVASHLGALAEAVRHEVDGLLVESGSVLAWQAALQRLVDDPALVQRLRLEIRPPMYLDEHVSRLQALYDEVIGGHGK